MYKYSQIQSMYKRHKSSPEDHLIIIAHQSFYHLLIIIIRSSFDHYQDIIWSLAGHRYYLVIAIRAFFSTFHSLPLSHSLSSTSLLSPSPNSSEIIFLAKFVWQDGIYLSVSSSSTISQSHAMELPLSHIPSPQKGNLLILNIKPSAR